MTAQELIKRLSELNAGRAPVLLHVREETPDERLTVLTTWHYFEIEHVMFWTDRKRVITIRGVNRMSPKSLQELGLKDEGTVVTGDTLADLPVFGTFTPPPQPGPFRFKLPTDLTTCYEVYDTPTKTPPQRVRLIFDQDHPLEILQSVGGKYNGQPFQTRLSNEERSRGKDKAIVASDWDYLLRALGIQTKPTRLVNGQKVPDNRGYIEATRPLAGREFGGDIRYSWKCDEKRNIRVATVDPQTNQRTGIQEVDSQRGCGNAFYGEDVPNNPDGTKPLEITCQCGALLRAFANLDNLRA